MACLIFLSQWYPARNMSQFRFQVLEMRSGAPQVWLRFWADRYPSSDYNEAEYRELIAKHNSLSSPDFERIGKWKDGAKPGRRWKPNVASVAFRIWRQAASKPPKCPEEERVGDFLEDWSNRKYTDKYKNGVVREKRFGLSRATTLLHFVSGGDYPIFDSRVKTAIARLLGRPELSGNVSSYLESYVPLFMELADCCGTTGDLRKLDKALFSYGALEEGLFSN
jgi:hypothetical protein